MIIKNILLSAVALTAASSIYASSPVKGRVINTEKEPVVGANIFWKNTTNGTVTDIDGYFEIPSSAVSDTLVASYIGFHPHQLHISEKNKDVEIELCGEVALQEVTVRPDNPGLMQMRMAAGNIQKITSHELGRAACCNLAESFETNPSVDVSYSDAATGARQIQLLGLSGKYVQMLTEQVPSFTSAASLYGLNYVPGPWMESIQVSKGTSSVKNGYDAMSGQINIEYKKPQNADPLTVNLFAADNGRFEANADANIKINDNLATGIFAHYSNEMKGHDGNDDGFSDLPRTEQVNVMNRWFYKKNGFISQSVINMLSEKRLSGQLTHSGESEIHNPYDIDIRTNRASAYTKNGYVFGDDNNTSIAMILSGAYHNQQSSFGNRTFDVLQRNLYANLIFEQEYSKIHSLSTGLSLNAENISENIDQYTSQQIGNHELKQNDIVAGAYGQYTLNIDHKLILQAGIRADYHKDFGVFASPRVHLKYEFAPWLTTRISAGKGYRISNPLGEHSYLLASSRKLTIANNIDRLESAWNYGLALSSTIPLFGKDLQLNAEWYYTDFDNQVVADMDSDAHAVMLRNNAGRSYSSSVQFEATYPFFKGFTLTGAFRYTDAKTNYNGELKERYLNGRYKGMLTASYQTNMKKWQFDLTAQFNGPGRMPDADMENPMWENEYGSFTNLNGQITKNFRRWSVYLGAENLLNFKQSNPIIDAGNPWGDNFDATMVWGPVHGRKIYAGLRFNL